MAIQEVVEEFVQFGGNKPVARDRLDETCFYRPIDTVDKGPLAKLEVFLFAAA